MEGEARRSSGAVPGGRGPCWGEGVEVRRGGVMKKKLLSVAMRRRRFPYKSHSPGAGGGRGWGRAPAGGQGAREPCGWMDGWMRLRRTSFAS